MAAGDNRLIGNDTPEIAVGAIGGVATGYVLWLVVMSIGYNITTVSQWSLIVLILSMVSVFCSGMCGWWLRQRRKHAWGAFTFGLPVFPVVLTLAVLAKIYL
ncbi:hypothetical protein JK2ML_2388 [Mycobacterium leprae Kyoto-2]|uniref:Possible membrane protein n=3 Tax=Mycobacterium leprae TaxID=1769 RepID=Q7APV4_MYCLE|nr:hypothetical protein [Mycobacterium leprae]OAX70172.1 hypothetical protein A3216_13530 [Mycobacterium leprae 7935681]CAR72486.1 possible membrane protein [Mycobacterium leprae Br4923]AAA63017.1 u1740k [Mycobacterium leprae]AWV48663.1 hypothetical protein DIJ64_13140 [Mycobacterium leprae]OAR19726.1 hypothetical protein A8144_13535 [Mycobacterium leprae 3125609]